MFFNHLLLYGGCRGFNHLRVKMKNKKYNCKYDPICNEHKEWWCNTWYEHCIHYEKFEEENLGIGAMTEPPQLNKNLQDKVNERMSLNLPRFRGFRK